MHILFYDYKVIIIFPSLILGILCAAETALCIKVSRERQTDRQRERERKREREREREKESVNHKRETREC